MIRRLHLLLLSLLALMLALAAWYDHSSQHTPPPADATGLLAAAAIPATPLPSVVTWPAAPTLVVHSWAGWCPPCVVELPQLLDAARILGPAVQVVAVSQDADPSAMQRAIARAGGEGVANIRWLHDPSGTLALALFGSRQLPETLLAVRPAADAPPTVTHHLRGPVPWPTLVPLLQSKP